MTTVPTSEVLFVGHGSSSVAWYRCYLPAMALGMDHVGLVGDPPQAQYTTGLVQKESKLPNWTNYKTVVLQQPRGEGWLQVIKAMRQHGTTVLFEVDDWLHQIKNQPDHDFRQGFTGKDLAEFDRCMKACDGLIVSTDFLAKVYGQKLSPVWVCENGVDLARYKLTRPKRPTINIGWAGATGHADSVRPWLRAVARVMDRHPETCFISIGQPFADMLRDRFGDRVTSVPFTAVEQYPSAMTMLDIAIAPAGRTGFFKAKSDLRWLEAGALGIPIVADPFVYAKIKDGVNGLHASTEAEVETQLEALVSDAGLRTTVGHNARTYVENERRIEVTAQQWRHVFDDIAAKK